MKKYSFTLLELIVVLAIIGVLVTILLPSLERAREESLNVVCLNNSKQISAACIVYAVQNNQNFPIGAYGNYSWDDYLGVGSYDGRKLPHSIAKQGSIKEEEYASRLYYCPTADRDLNTSGSAVFAREYVDSKNQFARTYSLNSGCTSDKLNASENDPKSGITGLGKNGSLKEPWSAKMAEIEQPSETILTGEFARDDAHLSNGGPPAFLAWKWVKTDKYKPKNYGRHVKMWYTNMSFVDGTAKSINILKTYDSSSDNMWDRN